MRRLWVNMWLSIIAMMLFAVSTAAQERQTLMFMTSNRLPSTVDRVVNRVFSRLGYDVSVSVSGIVSQLVSVDAGDKDGLTGQMPGLERDYPDLVMVPEPVYYTNLVVFTREGVEYLPKMRTGRLRDEYNLPGDNAVLMADTSQELFRALLDGEIDAATVCLEENQNIFLPAGVSEGRIVRTFPCYIYLNKRHKDLAADAAAVLREMKESGEAWEIFHRNAVHTKAENPLVLYISSYSVDIEGKLYSGIKGSLPENAEIVTLSLNAEWGGEAQRRDIISSMIRVRLREQLPEIVIVSDNSAMEFMRDNYYNLFDGIPVVFTGIIDADGINRIFTGAVETPSAAETLDLMFELFPDTRTVFVINDYTASGRQWQAAIEESLMPYTGRAEIIYNEDDTMNGLVETVERLPSNAVILCGKYNVDFSGRYYRESESQAMFGHNARVPIFGLAADTIGYGQLGGKYVDSEALGVLAGEIAAQILDGNREIPIVDSTEVLNKWIFDSAMLEYFGVKPSLLPRNAVIINKPPSALERHPLAFAIAAALSVMTVLLAVYMLMASALTGNRNKYKKALERKIRLGAEINEKASALEAVNKWAEDLLGAAPVGFALIDGSTVTEMNRFFAEETGLSPGDDIAGPAAELLSEETLSLAKGRRLRVLKADNNTAIWLVDVEESLSQRDSLAGAQRNLEDLLEALPMALIIIDSVTRSIIYCNNEFIDMFGIPSVDEALGLDIMQFCPETQPEGESSSELMNKRCELALTSGRINTWEWQYVLPDGKVLEVQSVEGVINYQGGHSIAMVLKDISARKLRDRMLKNVAEKEKEASRLKSRFLVNVGHEIRSPMNAVIGLSELQMLKTAGREVYDAYKKINQSAKSLMAIINNILEFSRMEEKKVTPVDLEFVLQTVIDEVMSTFVPEANAKKIELRANIQSGTPNTVYGDRIMLRNILHNILDNAVKFTDSGSVTLSAESGLRITVEDTGTGMSEEELENLFKPFERSGVNAHSGAGLGAAIAKGFAEIMGGEITVSSAIGTGTTVTIKLPLEAGAGTLLEDREIVYGEEFRKSTQRYKIFPEARVLLCEDNQISQEVAKGILEIFRINPITAVNGREALELIGIEKFDLILMDVNMPVMDGYTAARAIRGGRRKNHNVPIVAMTGNTTADEIEQCRISGMNGYVSKPIDIHKLYQQLEQWLPKSMQAGEVMNENQKTTTEFKLDIDGAIARLGGKHDRYFKLLVKFAQSLPGDKLDYRSEEALRAVHSTKGAAGNLGIISLYEAAVACEKVLKYGEPSAEVYDKFYEICAETGKRLLKEYAQDIPQAEVKLPEGTAEEYAGLKAGFSEALLDANPVECKKLIALLKRKHWPGVTREKLDGVIKLAESYDFDGALELLES